MTIRLTAAIGDHPHTRALKDGSIASEMLALEFPAVSPISRAFAPMVRERRYDISELAIATFLQAKAAGARLTLLPVALAARFQEAALLRRADSAIRGPADLAGRRVGVRAYSQTTGLWLRGELAEGFGVVASDICWVTFEGAHVEAYVDPPFVERAPAGADMLAMLREGALDAIIVGNDMPDDPAICCVFPDPTAAARAFEARHGFMPINHVLVAKSEIVEARPEVAAELCRLFAASKALGAPAPGPDRAPMGREAMTPSLEMAARLAFEQGLVSRLLSQGEIWDEAAPSSEGASC